VWEIKHLELQEDFHKLERGGGGCSNKSHAIELIATHLRRIPGLGSKGIEE
jgi:hypothetical protein